MGLWHIQGGQSRKSHNDEMDMLEMRLVNMLNKLEVNKFTSDVRSRIGIGLSNMRLKFQD